MDDALGDVPAGDLLIADGRIAAVGTKVGPPSDAEIIDAADHIVLPGFVDTHFHMWNSVLRGLAHSGKGGFAATMRAIAPLFTPQDNVLGVRLATAQLIDGGVTAVHDWAHNILTPDHADAEISALADSGMAARFAYGYPQTATPDQPMDIAHLTSTAKRTMPGRLTLGACLRGPDRASATVWRREWDLARALGLPVTTHIASDTKAGALRGISQLAAADLLGPDTLMVHAVHASPEELAMLAKAGAPLSLSPWSELAVGYGLPQVAPALAAGVPIGLSIDNLVLAGQADMFAVMRLTADLASGMTEKQQAMPDHIALRWATIDGARALGLDSECGSLTPGKRADIQIVRADSLNTAAAADPVTAIVRTARPADVATVLIDGVTQKRNGRLLNIDVPALLTQATGRLGELRTIAGV
jgi:cytosine/adenosine deaminase-related metal-dependent hydrolase